ncbi:MAG: aspartate-semialdehyde dehydrogenase [Candidatus Syntropharchaeia archaeon]
MIKAAILGATGAVGQRFISLLLNHPWFEISTLLASERSAGKKYCEATKWMLDGELPEEIKEKTVLHVESYNIDADVVFSALPSSVARKVEPKFAEAGYAVASNASALRMEKDIPLVIPEVNSDHLGLIDLQREKRGWDGFIVTNPNCSAIMMTLTLKPLSEFGIEGVNVATMQAVSGAGFTGVSSMAILDNLIPFISGEEEKMETEPLKILGEYDGSGIKFADFRISASCHRVPVLDGHTEAIWVKLRDDPDVEEIKRTFRNFRSGIHTPTSPQRPVILREEMDRPQPRLDRDAENGMSVSVGRVRKDSQGVKYIALGHNTVRGAAGASILNAEVLVEKGYLK